MTLIREADPLSADGLDPLVYYKESDWNTWSGFTRVDPVDPRARHPAVPARAFNSAAAERSTDKVRSSTGAWPSETEPVDGVYEVLSPQQALIEIAHRHWIMIHTVVGQPCGYHGAVLPQAGRVLYGERPARSLPGTGFRLPVTTVIFSCDDSRVSRGDSGRKCAHRPSEGLPWYTTYEYNDFDKL